MRTMTRRERSLAKKAQTLPLEVACINFAHDSNYLSVVRSAVCFGAQKVHLIGSCELPNKVKRATSGTTLDFIETVQHSSPREFLDYCEKNAAKPIALELPEDCGLYSEQLNNYEFMVNRPSNHILITGHETHGIPTELLYYWNTDIVHIPLPGQAHCLNTAQALTVALYEFTKQYMNNA